jgi:hypothetical protein
MRVSDKSLLMIGWKDKVEDAKAKANHRRKQETS